MFLHVGSGTNESIKSDFSTRIKSLHILGNFSKLSLKTLRQASTVEKAKFSRKNSEVKKEKKRR